MIYEGLNTKKTRFGFKVGVIDVYPKHPIYPLVWCEYRASQRAKKNHVVIQYSIIFDLMAQAPNSYRKPKEVVTRETSNEGIKYYDSIRRMWVVFKTQEKMDSFLERMKLEEKMYLSR